MFLFIFSISLALTGQALEKPTILVVLAHPDDEMAIGPVLTKFQNSHKVQLVLAFTRWEAKDTLVQKDGMGPDKVEKMIKMRQDESRCGCETLGIEAPIFLDYNASFSGQDNLVLYFKQSIKLKDRLKELIQEQDPALIITFGPDGDTGHPDHRAISNMVTEVVITEGWVEQHPVYYISWTQRDREKFLGIPGLYLNTTAPQYINTTIGYSEQEEAKYLKALSCYPSQYDENTVKDWSEREKNDTINEFYFRKLAISKEKQNQF